MGLCQSLNLCENPEITIWLSSMRRSFETAAWLFCNPGMEESLGCHELLRGLLMRSSEMISLDDLRPPHQRLHQQGKLKREAELAESFIAKFWLCPMHLGC